MLIQIREATTFPGVPLYARFCKGDAVEAKRSHDKSRWRSIACRSSEWLVSWGSVGREPGISLFTCPDVDVFIAGDDT